MDNPKVREYSSREAKDLLRKAARLGYPIDDETIAQHMTLWQLDEVITHDRYDC